MLTRDKMCYARKHRGPSACLLQKLPHFFVRLLHTIYLINTVCHFIPVHETLILWNKGKRRRWVPDELKENNNGDQNGCDDNRWCDNCGRVVCTNATSNNHRFQPAERTLVWHVLISYPSVFKSRPKTYLFTQAFTQHWLIRHAASDSEILKLRVYDRI